MGRSPGRCSEQLWWCSSTSPAAGCRREKGCHAGQHPSSSWEAFAWQLACSLQLLAARWWLSCPLSPPTSPSSKQPLLLPAPGRKGVAGTLCKSKYLHSRGLPSPALDFLPLLKMSQISCFHNWAGNEFPAGWQLNTLVHHGSNICLCCLPPRAAGIFRGWMWLGRRRKQARSSTTTQHG